MLIPILKSARNWFHITVGIRTNVSYSSDLILGPQCYLTAPDHLELGRKVRIGRNCFIACNGRIGDGVLISSYVGVVGRYDHDATKLGSFVSEAPWIYSEGSESLLPKHRVEIGDDVWVGYGATILSGVSIGRGAIIGAKSLVTKDVPSYSIVAGAPAKVIGARFSKEAIKEHELILYGSNGQ